MIDPLYSSDQASGLWIYVEHSDAAIEGRRRRRTSG
jgi:hypothetical protein